MLDTFSHTISLQTNIEVFLSLLMNIILNKFSLSPYFSKHSQYNGNWSILMPLYELGNDFTMMLSQFLLQISKNERTFSLCDYSVVKGQQIVLK